jgi:PKD repeat protein
MTTDVIRWDLNLSVLADQPTHFPKISQIIPEPNDPWPDYVLIYTADPSFLMDGYYLQKNDGVLNGPVQALTGISNSTAYYYANLTSIDLNTCGDELKLVWSNTGLAFGGMDIVVDRVEWNATVGGCHFTEPDNTIATDATSPAAGFAIHRTGAFPVYADDTNDNAMDFVTDAPWPRPIIGAPNVNWDIPAGGEDWTGGMNHDIQFTAYDDNALNTQLDFWVNYSTNNGGTWSPAVLTGLMPGFAGWGDAANPMVMEWAVPCDVPHTDLALLNATAVNPNLKEADVISNAFTIDCEAPAVLSTIPGPGAIDVMPPHTITVTFSEDMGATNASIVPDPGGVGTIPLTADTIEVTHGPLAEDVNYCVYVFGSDDSITGNNMSAVHSFCFTTYIVTPPWPFVDVPVGGEIWTGGSLHDIEFHVVHNGSGAVWYFLNYTCPTSSGPIVSGTDLPSPYSWTVPAGVDDKDCRVRLEVEDTDDGESNVDLSELFEIDSTAPTVLSTDPGYDQIDVAVDTTVVVYFSEKMDMTATEGAFSMQDTPTSTSVTGTFSWDAAEMNMTFTPDNDLAGATEYCFTITTAAKDVADPGLNMATDNSSCFTVITTNTAPTIALSNPTGATTWLGGGSGVIDWTMSDAETEEANLTVDVSYIWNSTTTAITTSSLTGLLTYTWTPVACPAGVSTDATIQIFVVVTDEGGLSANSTSAAFPVDCTPIGTVTHTGTLETGEDLIFSITGASHTIVTYAWDFGDGTTGTGASPTHTYDEAGDYTVQCTITDGAGNSGVATPETLTIEKAAEDGIDIMDYWWIILIIIIVVIILAIVLAKRKKPEEEEEEAPVEEEEEEYEEEEPEEELVDEEEEFEEEEAYEEEEPEVEEEAAPAEPEPEPSAPEPAPEAAAPAAEEAAPAEEAPAGETKECPSCGTVVPGDASECFLCGATL